MYWSNTPDLQLSLRWEIIATVLPVAF